MKGLYWFRNDLRLNDNSLIETAFDQCGLDLVFVWVPSRSFLRAERFRRRFVLESLMSLAKRVPLWIPSELEGPAGSGLDAIEGLIRKEGVQRLYITTEVSSEEQEDLAWVQKQTGVVVEERNQNQLFEFGEDTPEVFTAFRKRIEKSFDRTVFLSEAKDVGTGFFWQKGFTPCEGTLGILNREKNSNRHQSVFVGGEESGLEHLKRYFSKPTRVQSYKETRNALLEFDHSTKFSPWLSTGCLSPKRVVSELVQFEQQNGETESSYWIYFELLWREYFRHICFKHGRDFFTGMNGDKLKGPRWRRAQSLEKKLREADCGHEFIDACVRELNETGWSSNRARQNIASFFVHEMGGDYREGALFFEKLLVDYDVYSNWGNWAYLAGVGQDQRSRVFNPDRQADHYDSDRRYRDYWSRTRK